MPRVLLLLRLRPLTEGKMAVQLPSVGVGLPSEKGPDLSTLFR